MTKKELKKETEKKKTVKKKVTKTARISKVEEDETNNETNIENAEEEDVKKESLHKNNTKSERKSFNEMIMNAVHKEKFNIKKIQNLNHDKRYREYQESFQDVLSFRQKIKDEEISKIDTIIYHDENNDGMFSASIAYHYIMEHFPKKEILFIATKPGKFNFKDKIRNRNVIVLDLSIKSFFLKELIEVVDSYLVIDDHNQTIVNDKKLFNGLHHSACAYTWKFFYPQKEIPSTILYIDGSDFKQFSSFIPPNFTALFAHGIGFRYTHVKSKKVALQKMTGTLFQELWDLVISDISDDRLRFFILIGHYYQEVSESLKEQIAINAKPATFQGYRVGVLNFMSPALTKPVCRQIISNFRREGKPIDFAVCWGYEYTSQAYRIQLIDDHSQTKIHMGKLAKELGTIGGISKGGEGHPHVGNFYWPHSSKYDIWDLFQKKFI